MAIQSVKGTKDILPDQSWQWQILEETCRRLSHSFGYHEIRTPIFEKTELFSRGIGEGTDIVGKEMYTFKDKDGDSLTLRPELTASIVRAVLQHTLYEPGTTVRLWYYGAMFRHERPQKGRYRQFHQYGAELLGSPHPESDVEIIQIAYGLIRALGISEFVLKINTLGNIQSRLNYRNALLDYFRPIADRLSEDSRNRLEKNPLRILDSKYPDDKAVVQDAPAFSDFLDEESLAYFEAVQSMLTSLNIPFVISEQLVRGLDYYSHTVFECTTSLLGSQDALGGGGRYDGLFEQLGGKRIPAIGFSCGMERLLLQVESEKKSLGTSPVVDVYILSPNEDSRNLSMQIAQELRTHGIAVVADLQRRSFKAQMREAHKIEARNVMILGEEERKRGNVLVKNMTTGEQVEYPIHELAGALSTLLSST